MPAPTVVPGTLITAAAHWNPLADAVNDLEDQVNNAILGSNMAAGGISNIATASGLIFSGTTGNAALNTRVAALETTPAVGRCVARGVRTTASGNAASTTFVGVLRIDNVSLTAGRLYRISTNSLLAVGTVSGDWVTANVRYNTSGVATTASTSLPGSETRASVVTASSGIVGSLASTTLFVPGANGTYSFLLNFRRETGTGSVNINANGGDRLILLSVFDHGVAPADTGVSV